MILNSNNTVQSPKPSSLPLPESPLSSIFSRLTVESSYKQALQDLFEFVQKDPKVDLAQFLNKCPSLLYNRITDDLTKLREVKTETSESYNFQDFQNRLALMKKRYGLANQPLQVGSSLTDLKAKVNTLLSKTSEESSLEDVRERLKIITRK